MSEKFVNSFGKYFTNKSWSQVYLQSFQLIISHLPKTSFIKFSSSGIFQMRSVFMSLVEYSWAPNHQKTTFQGSLATVTHQRSHTSRTNTIEYDHYYAEVAHCWNLTESEKIKSVQIRKDYQISTTDIFLHFRKENRRQKIKHFQWFELSGLPKSEDLY